MNCINYSPRIQFALLLAHCLLSVVAEGTQRQQVAGHDGTNLPFAPRTPKDYALPLEMSRVRKLKEHFEMMEKSANDINFAQTTSVILSLSQSASKLYTLAHGLPLDVRCNHYVRLISLPDIRDVSTVNALVKESGPLNELVQTDANLIARLTSERDFDSLARIQTIIQTLESEKTLGKSNFEPIVEKELLECVNYYVYRHQNAVSNVIGYVRDSMEDISKHLVDRSESKVFVEKFRGPIERIISIERDEKESAQFNYNDWIQSLSQIQTLASQNDFEIPQLVNDFLADRQRVQRLYMWFETHELKSRILEIESKKSWLFKNPEEGQLHKAAIQKLYNICSQPDQEMQPPTENCKILEEPKRAKIAEELIKRVRSGGGDMNMALASSKVTTQKSRPVSSDSAPKVLTRRQGASPEISQEPCPTSDGSSPSESWIINLFDSVWSSPRGKQHSKTPCKAQGLEPMPSEGLMALI